MLILPTNQDAVVSLRFIYASYLPKRTIDLVLYLMLLYGQKEFLQNHIFPEKKKKAGESKAIILN